jgi:NADH-quinone oxidoreductase subunit C
VEARHIFDRAAARLGEAVSALEDPTAAEATDTTPAPPGPAAAAGKAVARDAFFRVTPAEVAELGRFLRDDPDLRFDFLQNLTAVDWPKREVMELVYHLFSYRHRHAICVKTEIPRAAPHVPSVTGVWPTADWLEREQFDLLGVVFDGHPDLRRLLMPDDWVGHPMRKDFKEPRSYRGMPTSRPSPLELLAAYDRSHGADAAKKDSPP